MQVLAGQLGIGRATLYRWVASREELLSQVFDELAAEIVQVAGAAARGRGTDRVVHFIERIIGGALALAPLIDLARQEPQLALRLLLSSSGRVHSRMCVELHAVVIEHRPDIPTKSVDVLTPVIVQVATALVWGTFVIGDPPQTERALTVVKALLDSAPSAGD